MASPGYLLGEPKELSNLGSIHIGGGGDPSDVLICHIIPIPHVSNEPPVGGNLILASVPWPVVASSRPRTICGWCHGGGGWPRRPPARCPQPQMEPPDSSQRDIFGRRFGPRQTSLNRIPRGKWRMTIRQAEGGGTGPLPSQSATWKWCASPPPHSDCNDSSPNTLVRCPSRLMAFPKRIPALHAETHTQA